MSSAGQKVLRVFGRVLCAIVGIACLAAGPIVLLGCYALILVASSGERMSIRETGLPASHHLLSWSEWHDGGENILPFDGYDLGEIVAYRIGAARGTVTELTFYQAKYRTADGEIVVGPASGLKPLIGIMPYRLAAVFIAGMASGTPLLWLAFRRPKRSS